MLAADVISKQGFRVDVFEEHGRVGYPVHCAGMVSVEGFRRLGIEPRSVFHQNTILGGRIFSSDGSCITIRDRKPRAYIIDRGRFDAYLAEVAESNGANINTGSRVDQVIFRDGVAKGLMIEGSEVESGVVIDAEGALGRVLGRSGIIIGQVGVLNGFNVEVDVDEIESDMVEVWFSQEIAKDFFTWVIPISENRVRCGLATSSNNGAKALKHFIEKRFNKDPVSTIHSGLACIGGPVNKTAYPGLLLAGDVAGQVKPTTGGGVVLGGLCAQLAGEMGARALGGVGVLADYENEWRRRYGSELQTMLILRRLLNGLSDAQMNRAVHVFLEEGLEQKFTHLVEQGDMDMQAGVIKRAITDPAILAALARSLGKLVVSEIFSVFGV